MKFRLGELELRDDRGEHRAPDYELLKEAERIGVAFEEIASSYAQQRQFVTVRPRSRKQKVDPRAHLYEAAELARKLELSPEAYVKLQIEAMLHKDGKIWSTRLLTESLIQSIPEDRRSGLERIRHYKSQLALLDRQTTLRGARAALEDTVNEFTPLFRCLMAYENGFKDITHAYKMQALAERAAVPEAEEVFGEMLRWLDG